MAAAKRVALVMAGGSGTRFWPLSTPQLPKQYLPLAGERSLIQQTVDRVSKFVATDSIHICSTQPQAALLREQLPNIHSVVFEPFGRNTAACLMLSVAHLLRSGLDNNTPMFVFPADAFIADTSAFLKALESAEKIAIEKSALVTFGIVPKFPHTGYGYIQAKELNVTSPVTQFVEKPTVEAARELLKTKNTYWNSGMFAWTLGNIRAAFERHCGLTWKSVSSAKGEKEIASVYQSLPSTPVDKAVLEKADNVWVVPCSFDWSDVGSWGALFDLHAQDKNGNVAVSGKLGAFNTSHCLVSAAPHKVVTLIGVKDLIIVDKGDQLLICHKDSDQLVKEVAEKHGR